MSVRVCVCDLTMTEFTSGSVLHGVLCGSHSVIVVP